MKRIPFLLTIGFILVVIASLFVYTNYFKKESIKIWDIIPDHAILVYEIGECETCLEQIRVTPFWQVISKTFVRELGNDSIRKLFTPILDPKNNGIISLHVTRKDDFDFIYFIPKNGQKELSELLNAWKNKNSIFVQREFSGIQINELAINSRIFSWIWFEDLWIGSYTPLLIEDVIRTYKGEGNRSYRASNSEVFQLSKIKNDAGNIYFNLNSIGNFLTLFLEKNFSTPTIGWSSLLDIKPSANSITLNGFSLAQNNNNTVLSYFNDQSPVPFNIKQYISNRSIVVTNYGISDGLRLFENLDIFKNQVQQDSLKSLAKIDLVSLFSGLGKEMSLCLFESRGANFPKVLLFNTTNTDQWMKAFDLLSKASEKEDSLYYEKYSSYEIREIGIKNLPEKLFKPLVKGFSQTYYSSLGGTIIISEHVEELRRFLDDIDREDVWGKSVAFNQFLETTLLESNISIYINTPRAISAISPLLNSKWREMYPSLRNSFYPLGFSAYQFSHLNETFYTNITWTFNPEKKSQLASVNRIQTNIESSIASLPVVVKNHVTKKSEFVVQDSLYYLHYFSSDGKRQWKKEISGKIIGSIHQLDYYKNNKLQLFFVTEGKLHVIDRLGNYVSPFPMEIPQKNIEFVSLIDYDNSKRYRYLLADKSGKLWLLDREGKNLDGWKPMNIEGSLFAPPRHHRIRGKDFIMAIRKDGMAYLKNRRGENVKGFPLDLEIRPIGDYHIEPGNTTATTYFVVVSRDGIKVKFNVEGKVISREPLVKSSVDDKFSLLVEENQKTYLILKQNSRQLTLLDEAGKIVANCDFIGSNTVSVKYYDFGSERSYILISDLIQHLCYVYDGHGKLLTPTPVESTGVSLSADGEKILIITVNDQSLSIQPLFN